MKYFTGYNKVNYTFPNRRLEMMNIFNRPSSAIQDESEIYENMEVFIEDGMSPDRTSKLLYKTSDMFWVVLLFNNIIDVYKQWPTSYTHWKNELYSLYVGETFYTEYKLDLQVGDIVAKKLTPPDGTVDFDKNNYGTIVSFDHFRRSFDVSMLKGNIEEGQQFFILRKVGVEPTKVIPPGAPNPNTAFTLRRKVSRLDSLSSFIKTNPLNFAKYSVSPYSNISGNNIVSHTVDNINAYQDTLIYKYIYKQPLNQIQIKTFEQEKESEWLFNKKIRTFPDRYMIEIENSYYNAILGNQ